MAQSWEAVVKSEFTEEQIRAVFLKHGTYLDEKIKKTTRCAEEIRRVYGELKSLRSKTIGLIDTTIKFLGDDSAHAAEILLKASSAWGKCLMFTGPLGMVAGSVISVTCDLGNAVSSASRESQKDQYLNEINRLLERDTRKAKELCRLAQMTRMLSRDIKDCIKYFHVATVHGFYDSLPELKKFTKSVCKITDINDPKCVYEFLRAVGIASMEFRKELSFSFSSLLRHNRDGLWCAVSVLEIAVTSGIGISVAVTAAEIGLSACGTTLGKALTVVNVFSIFCDVVNIADKAAQQGKESPIMKRLKDVKRKLQDENKNIDKKIQNFLYAMK